MATCDYVPTVEVGVHRDTTGKGMVAGGMRARPVISGGTLVAVSGHATKKYCSRTHLSLGEHGELRAERAITEELVHLPALADGHEVV